MKLFPHVLSTFFNRSLFKNSRFYVLASAILFSVVLYINVKTSTPQQVLLDIKLTKDFGLVSVVYIYLSLLIGPLYYTFKDLPYKKAALHARRAIGVSAFYFALLHTAVSFFGTLGGFSGILFLGNSYLFSLGIGVISLIIFFFLTVTSVDYAVSKMKFKNWKILHRLTYIASFLVILHTVILGSDFAHFDYFIPQTTLIAVIFLCFLEARRLDAFIRRKQKKSPFFGIATTLFIATLTAYVILLFIPSPSTLSINIHARHVLIASQIQNSAPQISSSIPGFDGDRTKRFTASMYAPPNISPQQDTTITFDAYDASSGNKVVWFKTLYSKPMHIIIVDDALSYFSHIHPVQNDSSMQITTSFPHVGRYHIYISFQPLGGIEQQIGFTLNVGDVAQVTRSVQKEDAKLTKTFGDYTVSMSYSKPLLADSMNTGSQSIAFSLHDKNGKPVKTLKPYLSAFGHLTMIRQDSYDFLHVHPSNIVPPKPDANGGPTVEFIPMSVYNKILPGTYRVFAEFNPDNNLMTADFTVKVE